MELFQRVRARRAPGHAQGGLFFVRGGDRGAATPPLRHVFGDVGRCPSVRARLLEHPFLAKRRGNSEIVALGVLIGFSAIMFGLFFLLDEDSSYRAPAFAIGVIPPSLVAIVLGLRAAYRYIRRQYRRIRPETSVGKSGRRRRRVRQKRRRDGNSPAV